MIPDILGLVYIQAVYCLESAGISRGSVFKTAEYEAPERFLCFLQITDRNTLFYNGHL